MLQTERTPPPSAEESQPLVVVAANATDTDEDTVLSYQQERKLKHHGNKTLRGLRVALYILYGVYILSLEGLAVAEFTQINPSHILDVLQNQSTDPAVSSILGKLIWLILVSGAAGWSFAWWLYTIIAASENAIAVSKPESTELPYPPTQFTVSWSTVQLLMWLIVEGATVVIWILQNDFSNVVQAGAFLGQMFLILFFGAFTTFGLVLHNFRMTCDSCLRCCKSPCHDC